MINLFCFRRNLQKANRTHIDVTALVQKRVEEFGGGILELVAGRDDPNRLFGNPLPGQTKELRVRYLITVRG